MTVRVERNVVRGLRQGPKFESVLAEMGSAADHSRLRAKLDPQQAEPGNPDDLNLVVEGADSERWRQRGGTVRLHATVTRNLRERPRRRRLSAKRSW